MIRRKVLIKVKSTTNEIKNLVWEILEVKGGFVLAEVSDFQLELLRQLNFEVIEGFKLDKSFREG